MDVYRKIFLTDLMDVLRLRKLLKGVNRLSYNWFGDCGPGLGRLVGRMPGDRRSGIGLRGSGFRV